MTAAAVDEVTGGRGIANRPVGDYAADAQRIMAEHPSTLGWEKRESRSCGGRHPSTPGAGRMVLWRRRRDYSHPETHRVYDIAEDPPLWVAQQLPTGLCVSEEWARQLRTFDDFPLAAAVHGHLGVARDYITASGQPLGKWFDNQKTAYRAATLAPYRARALADRFGRGWFSSQSTNRSGLKGAPTDPTLICSPIEGLHG